MLHTNIVLCGHLFLLLQENDKHAILVVFGFLLSFLGNRKKGRMLIDRDVYHCQHIIGIFLKLEKW